MIEIKTEVTVPGINAKQVYDFMLNCTDAEYQKWWPDTHFSFHTKKRCVGNVGNVVHFDELVGNRRIKSEAIVVEVAEDKKIVWQVRKILKMPVWIELSMENLDSSVFVVHTLKVGYRKFGRVFDLFIRLVLNNNFKAALNKHTSTEFLLIQQVLGETASPHPHEGTRPGAFPVGCP